MSSCQLCGNFFLSVGSEVVYTEMAVPNSKWNLSMLNFTLWTNPKSSLTVFFLGTFAVQRDYILQETASFQKTYGLTTLTVPHPSVGIGLNLLCGQILNPSLVVFFIGIFAIQRHYILQKTASFQRCMV
jgi:hypothetical protein